MNKDKAIEQLYTTFNKYTTSDMHYCPCGCIDTLDVKKLASKGLRNLAMDDIVAYHGSALHTWGELKHYKHFLPRILELNNKHNGFGLISLFEIKQKFEHTDWPAWDQNEVLVIKDFLLLDWKEKVNGIDIKLDQDSIKEYTYFLDIDKMLDQWRLVGPGLKNFVESYYELDGDLVRKIMLKQGDELLENLEEEFFSIEADDKEYGDRISVVITLLEYLRN